MPSNGSKLRFSVPPIRNVTRLIFSRSRVVRGALQPTRTISMQLRQTDTSTQTVTGTMRLPITFDSTTAQNAKIALDDGSEATLRTLGLDVQAFGDGRLVLKPQTDQFVTQEWVLFPELASLSGKARADFVAASVIPQLGIDPALCPLSVSVQRPEGELCSFRPNTIGTPYLLLALRVNNTELGHTYQVASGEVYGPYIMKVPFQTALGDEFRHEFDVPDPMTLTGVELQFFSVTEGSAPLPYEFEADQAFELTVGVGVKMLDVQSI